MPNAALEAYMEICPNDPLDDLTEEDKKTFQFTTVRIQRQLVAWPDVLVQSGICDSKSAARRLISAGAIRCDGDKVETVRETLCFPGSGELEVILQVGRQQRVVAFV
jgi:tyrosyl-tRNA synthetase